MRVPCIPVQLVGWFLVHRSTLGPIEAASTLHTVLLAVGIATVIGSLLGMFWQEHDALETQTRRELARLAGPML